MAKKKAKKISFMALAVVILGLVLVVVGVCVPWFTGKVTLIGSSDSSNYGIFENKFPNMDFPFEVVQSFGFIALIFAVIVSVAMLCKTFKVLKIGTGVKLVLALVNALFAILAMVFAIVFVNQFGGIDAGQIISTSITLSAGAFLVAAGGVVTSVGVMLR